MNAELFNRLNVGRTANLSARDCHEEYHMSSHVGDRHVLETETLRSVSTEIVSITSKQSILTTKWNHISSVSNQKRVNFSTRIAFKPLGSSDDSSVLIDQENKTGFYRGNMVNQAAWELANCADQISGLVSRVLETRVPDFSEKEQQLRERIDSMETVVCEKDRELAFFRQQLSVIAKEKNKASVPSQTDLFTDAHVVELDEAHRMIKLQVEEARMQEESFLRELAYLRQMCEIKISNLICDHEINILKLQNTHSNSLQLRDDRLDDSVGTIRLELEELGNDWRHEMDLRKKMELELSTIRESHKSEIAQRDSEIIALRVARIQSGDQMNVLETTISDLNCLVQTLRIRNDCLNRENTKLVVLNEFWKKKNDC